MRSAKNKNPRVGFILGVLSLLLALLPPAQAVGSGWVLGDKRAHCGETCAETGRECSGEEGAALTTNALVGAAFAEAGYTCLSYHDPRDYAGTPFYKGEDPNELDCAPFLASSSKISSCTEGSIHYPLCYCKALDNGACFHGNGTVLLQSGATKPLSELIIGEFIMTHDAEGKFSFSPIKTLPHANNNEPAAFLALKTETGKEVEMTSDHYIPKCDLTVVTAGELVVGDCLLSADGKETLMGISWTEKYGVYTAVTEDKFVVVNGIVASAFSKDSHPEERELDYKKYSMELERMKTIKFLDDDRFGRRTLTRHT